MKTILTLIMFASGIACTSLAAQETTHRFIAFGQKTYMIGADGKPTWTYPHATRDGYVLDNGNIVLTLSKGKRYPGGAVIEIDPDGKESLIWKGTQSEVNSAQPTDQRNIRHHGSRRESSVVGSGPFGNSLC